MVNKETKRVVGKVLYKESGSKMAEGMGVQHMRKISGNRISKSISSQKNSKKGFTLVELIVVLVILTILTAVAVPVMLGVINHTREKNIKVNADAALKAAQAELTELYNNCSNTLYPRLRTKIMDNSGHTADDGSAFWIWTGKDLKDGQTTSIQENIASYTIVAALYKEKGAYYFYDGNEWNKIADTKTDEATVVENAKNKAGAAGITGSAIARSTLLIWPGFTEKMTDVAYGATHDDEGGYGGDDPAQTITKTLHLIANEQDGDENLVSFKTDGNIERQQIDIEFKFDSNTLQYKSDTWDGSKYTVEEGGETNSYSFNINEDYIFDEWELINGGDETYKATGSGVTSAEKATNAVNQLKTYIFSQTNKSEFTFKANITEIEIEKTAIFKTCNSEELPFGKNNSIEVKFIQKKHHPDNISAENWDKVTAALDNLQPWGLRGWFTSDDYSKDENGIGVTTITAGADKGYSDICSMLFGDGSSEGTLTFTTAMQLQKTANLNIDTRILEKLNKPEVQNPYPESVAVSYTRYLPEDFISDNWNTQIDATLGKEIVSVVPLDASEKPLLREDDKELELKKAIRADVKTIIKTLLYEGRITPVLRVLKGGQVLKKYNNENLTIEAGATSIDVSEITSMSFNAVGGLTYAMFFADFGDWDTSNHLHQYADMVGFQRYTEHIDDPESAGWTDISIGGANDSYKDKYDPSVASYVQEYNPNTVWGKYDTATKIYYWYTEADKVYLNPYSSEMFCDCKKLTNIDFLGMDAGKVCDIEYRDAKKEGIHNSGFLQFFYNTTSLNSLSNFHDFIATANCGTYRNMFRNSAVSNIDNTGMVDVGIINLDGVTPNLSKMFLEKVRTSSTQIKISFSGTPNVVCEFWQVLDSFNSCTSATFDFSMFDVTKGNFEKLLRNRGGGDNDAIDYLKLVFAGDDQVNFKTILHNSTNTEIKKVKHFCLDLSNYNYSNIDFSYLLYGQNVLKTVEINGFDNKVKNTAYMFYDAYNVVASDSLWTSNMNLWNTSGVTNMNYMFYQSNGNYKVDRMSMINQIVNWNVENVKTAIYMFCNFNTTNNTNYEFDFTGWDLKSLEKASHMFDVWSSKSKITLKTGSSLEKLEDANQMLKAMRLSKESLDDFFSKVKIGGFTNMVTKDNQETKDNHIIIGQTDNQKWSRECTTYDNYKVTINMNYDKGTITSIVAPDGTVVYSRP
ncbi:MAG: BspA family leucine-rich repeat surface protein [Eubacterium sp.]|nr:BspA family leucine-rich repeat surface protein [Eubacterium sp.]